jgi:hypothetical protein
VLDRANDREVLSNLLTDVRFRSASRFANLDGDFTLLTEEAPFVTRVILMTEEEALARPQVLASFAITTLKLDATGSQLARKSVDGAIELVVVAKDLASLRLRARALARESLPAL